MTTMDKVRAQAAAQAGLVPDDELCDAVLADEHERRTIREEIFAAFNSNRRPAGHVFEVFRG